jgi:hypothetical protein
MATPKIYTTTIAYDSASATWNFDTNPPPPLGGPGNKHGKFKHNDQLNWICSYGDWIVFFDGPTPIEDIFKTPLGSVAAANATNASAYISKKAVVGQSYSYRVLLNQVNGDGLVVSPDPMIIIDTDLPDLASRRRPNKKKKKQPAPPVPAK